MQKFVKTYWPGFVLLGVALIYTILWHVMSGRVEDGIESWVERQARHGTEVTYDGVRISGYPFRLQAHFKNPQIVAREHESGFSWAGEELRLVTQVFNLRHIIIDLFGPQSLSFIDAPSDGSRTPSAISIDFTGDSLRGSLLLKSGRIQNIDTDFRDIIADIYTDGTITLIADGSDHVEIDRLEYHSRLLKEEDRSFTRDVMMRILGMTTEEKPSPELEPEIEEIVIAFSEEIGSEAAIHTGDIGADAPPVLAHRVTLHDAHIHWPPLSARLDGALKRKKKKGRFDGRVTLYLKGHETLVQDLAEAGETDEAVALIAGALFGILDVVTDETEAGETIVPLKIKDGEVHFGFLPLFQAE